MEKLVTNTEKFILQKCEADELKLRVWMDEVWDLQEIKSLPENVDKDLLIKVIFEDMKAVAKVNIAKQVYSKIDIFGEKHRDFYIMVFDQVKKQLYEENGEKSIVVDVMKATQTMPLQEIESMKVKDLVEKLEDKVKESFSKEILKKWINEVYTEFYQKSKLLQDIKLPLNTDKDL